MVTAFKRVSVDHVVAGGTRVAWEMDPHFVDPGPYDFQLQVGHTGVEVADDWEDVGSPVTDTYFALDNDKRVYGKTLDVYYRVKLTSSLDTYYSKPQNSFGVLGMRDWLIARELIRKELLRHRVFTSVNGYLLKARRYGPRCSTCLDEFTETVQRTNCETCYGTGFENGFFAPLEATYADVGLEQMRDHRDGQRGTVNDQQISARFLGDPLLYAYDVWVNSTSDERYYIHTVKATAAHRGVPIVFDAELRLAPFTDVIYTVPLDEEEFAMKHGLRGIPSERRSEKQPWQKQRVQANTTYLEKYVRAHRAQKKQRTRSRKR